MTVALSSESTIPKYVFEMSAYDMCPGTLAPWSYCLWLYLPLSSVFCWAGS